ncbi:hypothetical protein A2890_02570 [candidate division WWE3 bacterium RIFCSPLOWO2_01_FULL_53_14]|uniref:O-antigen ligase-related domain-containing protein n=1 Tax=candidate division WWE3 bacterium RIFCSPLOWO2_01_FULL_53_14 TaxID=1802628 RepID=A0A1F4VTC7_UNCKA|nr:MAG: hypothetical protein A2890_02570 [candidate division WWE3 bacterium RIFCSPLOWO2_01_FULL_53_14]
MGKFWGGIVEKRRKLAILPVTLNFTSLYPQVFHKKIFQIIRRKLEFSTRKVPTILILLFSFILILFPSNLAKHFIFSQSYVLGLLIDYLSPALYLTEILVVLLLLLSLPQLLRRKFSPSPKKLLILGGIFLAALLPSVWQGSFDLIGIWRWLELALWLGFGFWVAVFVGEKGQKNVFSLLGIAVFWVSLLALGQFLTQHSIFGYWFLGEPELSPSLGGMALGSWGGKEVLRAYGTFPHPNVLGGILSVILVWLAGQKRWATFGAGAGAVLFSLSKTAWVSLLGGLGVFFLLSFKSLFPSVAAVTLGDWQLRDDYSVTRRIELLESAGEMVKSSPWVGVGLGQFTRTLPDFGIPTGLSLFVQPAHNIFALVAAESGVLALMAFLALLFFAFRQTIRHRQWWLTISLIQLFFLGMFDHYLYTLPQGLFLFSLVLGLSFSEEGSGRTSSETASPPG